MSAQREKSPTTIEQPPTVAKRPRKAPAARRSRVVKDLYDQPGHLLRRAHQIAVGVFNDLVGPDITPIQYAILRMVHECPGIDQVSLARQVAVDTSTTAQTAARLESKGLLVRSPSMSDRRQLALTLSADGEALIDSLVTNVGLMRARLLSEFEPGEREVFVRLLQKFVHLNNDQSRAPLREPTQGGDTPG